MAKTSLWIGGVAVIALVAAGGYYLSTQSAGPVAGGGGKLQAAELITPPGITVQTVLGINPYFAAYGGQARNAVFADTKGMTLYTYDKDTEPGKSSCTGDCIKAWPAAVAPASAKAAGDWSVIARDDGTKQWAFKGKPLYTFVKDTDIGWVGGNAPSRRTRRRRGRWWWRQERAPARRMARSRLQALRGRRFALWREHPGKLRRERSGLRR